jgi:ADP-ribosylglycohydrolase
MSYDRGCAIQDRGSNPDVYSTNHPVFKLWNDAGCKDAGNGGVMRCMPTALWEPSLEERIQQTSRICMDTHPDPRCIESCVIIVEGLHELIEREFDSLPDAADVFEKMTDKGGLIRNADLIDAVIDSQYVKLDSLNNSGYTVDTVHCALAAFRLSESFEEGLIAIVNRGNDADTVGAVSGAIMGAYYGYSSIPKRWLQKLQGIETMMDHVQKMYTRKCQVCPEAE